MGASMPVYAILFGEVLGILSKSIPEAREESVFYSVMFLVVGVGKKMVEYLIGYWFLPRNTDYPANLFFRDCYWRFSK